MIRTQSRGGGSIRLVLGLVVAVISIISFLASQQYNPVTGENQHLSLTTEQEIALGLQAAPEMIAEFGGLHPDEALQMEVSQIGSKLVNESIANQSPWQFEYHVLADEETVNAFALPGGQIFITYALLSRFDNEDEVAGVLAHETVHVLARHSAQQIAKSDLTNGLVGAVGVAAGDANAAQTAAVIGQLVNMRYGRADETESDTLGVCLMIDAGYDPTALVKVMQILEEAGGGSGQPEFFSTHPSPENRIAHIQDTIQNTGAVCPS